MGVDLKSVPGPGGTRFVDDALVEDVDGETRLVGSACTDCGAVTFPAQGSCPRCAGQNVGRRPLARTGLLWGYTIQGFPPKPPYLGAGEPFVPYGVGYVDLGGEVLVETRIVADDLDGLRTGMPMEMVLEPFHRTAGGETIVTFAFAPVTGTPTGAGTTGGQS
jgi:uncharacterized OB-fold protein